MNDHRPFRREQNSAYRPPGTQTFSRSTFTKAGKPTILNLYDLSGKISDLRDRRLHDLPMDKEKDCRPATELPDPRSNPPDQGQRKNGSLLRLSNLRTQRPRNSARAKEVR